MNMRLPKRYTYKYLIEGVIIGFILLAAAIILELSIEGLSFSVANVIIIHLYRPAIWIVDIAPILLGIWGWLWGRNSGRYAEVIGKLSNLNASYKEIGAILGVTEKEKDIILNSVTELISFQDNDLKVIWANQAAIKVVEGGIENVIGRPCYNVWGKRDTPCDNCPVLKALSTGTPQIGLIETKNGRSWSVRGYPVRGSKGQIIGVVKISSEISDHIRLENQLRESESKYRSFVERANDGIVIVQDTIIKYANPSIAKMLGYEKAELVGRKHIDFVYPDERIKLNIIYQQRIAGTPAPSVYETGLLHKSGLKVNVEIAGGLISYEGKDADLIYIRDITERKQAQDVIRETEERYRDLVEDISEVIFSLDSNEIIDYISPAFRHLAKYNPVDLFDKKLDEYIYHEDIANYKNFIKRIFRGTVASMECRIITRDNRIIWVRLSCRPIFENNSVIGIHGLMIDITERRLAEEALCESEKRYRNITEVTSDYAFSYTIQPDGEFILDWIAGAIRQITGYTAEEIINHGGFRKLLIHPDDIEPVNERLRILQSNREDTFTFRIITKNGSVKYICHFARPIWNDEQNRVIGMIGAGKDVTEQIRIETALKESEETFRAISSSAHDAIVMVDYNSKITFWNEMAETMFGYKKDEIIGKSWHNILIPEEFKASYERVFNQILESETELNLGRTIELDALRKDRTRFSVELSLSIFILHNHWNIVAIIRDITERKQAEMALRQSQEMLWAVLDNIPQIIFWKDRNNNLMGCNKKFALGLGYNNPKDIIGKKDFEVLNNIDEAIRLNTYDHEVIETDTPKLNVIDKITLVNGQISWVEMNKVPLHDAEGRVIGLLGASNDITEKIAAEEERRKLREKLEKAQRMESLGMLAGGIAHDLNNMLGPLVGYSDLMLMELTEDNPLKRKAERILKASRDAADIIQDLLTLARRGRYEMIPLSLNDVVKDYLESPSFIQRKKQHPNVDIDTIFDGVLPNIIGSSAHLLKVIMNLIVNAFDAMPKGGKLIIETSKINLEKLSSEHIEVLKGEYISLKVSDTGIGIAPDDLNRIFEPYYSKKKMGTSGSGLGLAVVYGIIKDHKGYYDVISELGQGTTFILYFPTTDMEIKNERDDQNDYSGREKILVVDDIREQRELTSELLKSLGYEVAEVANGRQAIEYLSANNVDLIVLDMIMEPNFDGLDTYREIIKIRPSQKALIVSGFSATERVNKMQELGAGAYLKKPFTRIALGREVRQMLDQLPRKQTKKLLSV